MNREGKALKAISRTDDELRVGNYIALFGGKDLENEHFTALTDFESDYTRQNKIFVDWEHGLGQELDGKAAPGKDEVLGYVDWKTAKVDKMGLWVERVLDRRKWYMQYLEILIDAGMIANSSQAYLPDVVSTKSGEIKKWPLMRDTLTVMPMEPRMMTENVVSAVKGLNILPETETEEIISDAELEELQAKAKAILADAADEWTPEKARDLQLRARAMLALDAIDDDLIVSDCFERKATQEEMLYEQAANSMVKAFGRRSRWFGERPKPVSLRVMAIPAGQKAHGLAYCGLPDKSLIALENKVSKARRYHCLLHEIGHVIDANDRKSWAGQSKAYREDRANFWVDELDKVAIERIRRYWRRMSLQPRKIEIVDKVKALGGTAFNLQSGFRQSIWF